MTKECGIFETAERRGLVLSGDERFARVAKRDAVGFGGEGRFETLERLGVSFSAEAERRVVDRHQVFRAGFVGHFDGFLGIAVGLDVRVVSADRHDAKFEGAAVANVLKAVAKRGVAAEENALATAAEEVTVESAVGVMAPARAPVADLESFDLDVPLPCRHAGFFAPLEFVSFGEFRALEEIARAASGDDLGPRADGF